jgi:hypothetical protein
VATTAAAAAFLPVIEGVILWSFYNTIDDAFRSCGLGE